MGTTDILAKTAKGETEIAENSGSISLKHRSLLIMIDGKLTEADYLQRAKLMGDVQGFLRELEEKGYIERKQPAVRTQLPEHGGTEMLNIEARKYMAEFMYSMMGPEGDSLVLQLERCRNNKDLSDMLPVCFETISNIGKPKKAEEFSQKVKSMLA